MVTIFCIVAVMIYLLFSPESSIYFPKCPVYMLTGLQCPGCGSQRAIHELLNLNIAAAFTYNPLMVISIPYLLVGFGTHIILEYMADSSKKIYRYSLKVNDILFRGLAVKIVLVVIIGYSILRNLPCYDILFL